MQATQPTLFTRQDTIFGACEGIGEDFGFNAQFLRVGLAAMLFWNPVAAIGTYAVLAALVLFSRRLFPNPVTSEQLEASEAGSMAPAYAPLRSGNDEQPVELAAAA